LIDALSQSEALEVPEPVEESAEEKGSTS
jgi:hypothetical protein